MVLFYGEKLLAIGVNFVCAFFISFLTKKLILNQIFKMTYSYFSFLWLKIVKKIGVNFLGVKNFVLD